MGVLCVCVYVIFLLINVVHVLCNINCICRASIKKRKPSISFLPPLALAESPEFFFFLVGKK